MWVLARAGRIVVRSPADLPERVERKVDHAPFPDYDL
jgi:hypothetical protein